MAPVKSWIHKLNIVRFETLLAQAQDEATSGTLERLLSDERALLEDAVRLEREALSGPRARSPA